MIYAFGDYELDVDRYQLRWRGDELELEPKIFEVLTYLVRHRDRVVPKAELLEELWPDQVVGEWSLTRCISVARKALQDNSTEQRVIQTLYGRGYRFVAAVGEVPIEPHEPAPRSEPETGDDAPSQSSLIGRRRQLAELRAGLDAALSGRGRVILITGETGIGKTRLVEELSRLAEARGAAVRVGRCWETEGAPAYWPWIQILRSEARAHGPGGMRALLGSSAPEILQIAPELRDEIDDAPPAPAPAPQRQARFRLFDAVARLVKRLAQERPTVLILEDLHRADRPSLRLLEFVARETRGAPVLVVATYRDDELSRDATRSRIVSDLARASSAQHLPLEGLSPADVASFVRQATGEQPDEALSAALHQQTAGNPFFLEQVVPVLIEEDLLHSFDAETSLDRVLPRGVRQAILRQLDGLSRGAHDLLEVAAVQGRRFSLDVLETALDTSGDDIAAALGELCDRGVAVQDPERPSRYRFTHALIRDTLYSEIEPATRAQWHRRLGEAVESVHAGDDAVLAELAHHFSEARGVGGEKKALDYAVAAGSWARERLAYEEAGRYFERALELLDLRPAVDESQRCDLLVELGELQARAAEAEAARATLLRAAELARGLQDYERLARCAVAIASLHDPLARAEVDGQAISLLETALARLPERDSSLRARALASLALALYWIEQDDQRLARLAEDALAMARRLDDPSTQLFVMVSVLSLRWGPDFVEERAQLATEAVRVAQQAGVIDELFGARVQRLTAWFELGRMDAVDQELAEISRLTTEWEPSEASEWVPWFRAARAIMSGRFDVGERLASEFLDDVQRRGDETAMTGFAFQFFILRWTQGRCDELLDVVSGLHERNPFNPGYRTLLARSYCELGRSDEAQRELELLCPSDAMVMARRIGWLPCLALLAEVATVLGDTRRCAGLYRQLAPYARRHVAPASGYMGSASRYLGLLATQLGHWDMAERHFELALEMETRLGARPFVAWTQYFYARMLALRSADPERMRKLADRALENSRDLGLSPLSERILALSS